MRKIYLAARYSRHPELNGYAAQLRELGYVITSRWLNGSHQISDDGLSAEADAAERTRFALEDWEDLMAAYWCVNFTEPPRSLNNSRGGRHVEYGAALAAGLACVIVGPRENVFHALPHVTHFNTWDEALAMFRAIRQNTAQERLWRAPS